MMTNEERAQKVQNVLESSGWTKVVFPSLMERRHALMDSMLTVKTTMDFVRIQQAVNAIDNLISFMNELSSE